MNSQPNDSKQAPIHNNSRTNSLKKLPIGIQTFSHIREEERYLYIDKTHLAKQLTEDYKFVFLSRPRRFGKSLFLSTLQALFEGRKELFNGLAIEQQHNWNDTHPVIRIDMSGNQNTLEDAKTLIYSTLKNNQQRLDLVNCESDNLSVFFENLIHQAQHKYNQQVVVLIDEYDKPILDNITHEAVSEQMRDFLQGFYVIMKKNDDKLRFAFLTGVSKFSKVSVFSGLNNLQDISLNPKYATICGYTQTDIETTFLPYLQGVDLAQVKDWYNGYQFNGEPVYNPFDILKFIDGGYLYSNYWFSSGTPTFLIKQLQQKQYFLPNFENLIVRESIVNVGHIDKVSIEALLLQTGYLTIDKVIQTPMGLNYQLKLPNKEVKISLAECLVDEMLQVSDNSDYDINTRNALYYALQDGDLAQVKTTLTAIFASIPYHLYSNTPLAHYEGYYSVVLYAYLLSLGVTIELEKTTNKGRLDMVIDIADKRYLMEFKMSEQGNAIDAITQIKDKQYFQRFMTDTDKQIYLMGVSFDEGERNLLAEENGFAWEVFGK